MAISTMDGLAAAVAAGQRFVIQKASQGSVTANTFISLFDLAGIPAGGSLSIGNTGNGLVPTDATAGAPVINAFGSGNAGYLTDVIGTAAQTGYLVLYDRLFHAGSFAMSSLTSFDLSTQPSFASRLPDTDYGCVEPWLEVNTVASAANTTVALQYQAHDDSTGNAATMEASNINAWSARRMAPFRLAAGKKFKRLDRVTIGGATNTGSINIVLLRRLAVIPVFTANLMAPRQDPFTLGLPRVFEDSCLALLSFTTATSTGTVFVDAGIANG